MDVNIDQLKKIQSEIAKSVVLEKKDYPLEYFEFIVGVDLTFNTNEGIVCFSVFDMNEKKMEYFFERDKIKFPYIPGFLAFRELPLINKLYEKLDKELFNNKKVLFFIDGHGLSHPRKAGIATHFGVLNNTFSIGIAKRLLYGKIQDENFFENKQKLFSFVIDQNFSQIAVAIKTEYLKRKRIMNSKVLYISVGNKLNLKNSFELFVNFYKKYNFIPTEEAHNYLQKIRKKKEYEKKLF